MSLAISIEEEENVGVFSLLPSPEQASTSQAFGGRNMPESSMGSKPGTLPPRQVFPPLVSDGQHLGVRANTAFYKMLTHLEEEARMVLPNVVSTQPSLCTDGGELWVDKYRPHKFTDLLAMDSAHVEVLQWATQWRRHIEGGNHREDLNGKRRRLQGSSHDAEAIPFERSILLIHGPPGLGKTTLAHIVAQVGSFAPLEVNASDERSGDVVLERIKAALGSDSLDLQGFGRPHMIIIDEIDGAAAGGGEKGLITFLVKLANSTTSYGKGKGNSERKATNLDDDHDGGEEEEVRKEGLNGTTPGRRGRPALARPIICICNDLFASALRPLRQAHAGVRVVSMRRPTAAAIRQRLAEVCEKEGLRLEGKALLELIDMMDGDVRACLHALQFIARSSSLPGSRGKRPLNVADLREALRTAVRDVGRSTADVYESIFYADPLYKHHHHSVRGEVRSLQQAVLDTIIAHGEYERLATGAFELYPQCKFFDDTQLSRVNKGLEWLSFLDSCSTATLADERIAAYQPYTLLKFHHLFSSTTRPSFKFPRGDYEQHMVMRGMQEILRSYQTGLQQLHRKPFDQHYLLCERIPIVLRLIRPPVFRTVREGRREGSHF